MGSPGWALRASQRAGAQFVGMTEWIRKRSQKTPRRTAKLGGRRELLQARNVYVDVETDELQ